MKVDTTFWKRKRVFLTGNTGFKGAWLSIWLTSLGAEVYGYALKPPTVPSLFALARLSDITRTTIGDVRDRAALASALQAAQPDVVFHMAAQALVRESYADPLGTYETNILGTANLLEALRFCPSARAAVIITTDKCYENREWEWGYREIDFLGGHDPYSSSKACAEIVTAAYRRSFFTQRGKGEPSALIASARAGNVIGGGDWAKDRLIPDILRAIDDDQAVRIRSPYAIRPWQHVLEPLSGYILLAQKLFGGDESYAEAWNFGPEDSDAKPVQWIAERLCSLYQHSKGYILDEGPHLHEATYLKLDCSKSKSRLGWRQTWGLETALEKIVIWNKARGKGGDILAMSTEQILEYMAS